MARESRLLASAIAKLRQNREPEQALRILDQYQAEFAAGALAPEAAATRVETLLQLGRQGEALILLDAQPLTARWMGREMLVARAELRATRGRYSAAFADFEEALRTSQHPDSLKERSLYGRAICLSNRGDMQGARRSFERYLVEFPNGRFAEQARTAIQKLR